MHKPNRAGSARVLVAACGAQGSSGSGSNSSGSAGTSLGAIAAAGLAGAAAAAQLWPGRADCAAGPGAAVAYPPAAVAAAAEPQGWLSWAAGWLLPWRWFGGQPAEESPYLEAMRQDPRTIVVFAFALPHLSLSFGWTPAPADMDDAAKLIEPQLGELRPWELAGQSGRADPAVLRPATLAWEREHGMPGASASGSAA